MSVWERRRGGERTYVVYYVLVEMVDGPPLCDARERLGAGAG